MCPVIKLFVYYCLLGDGLLVQLFTGDLPVRYDLTMVIM